ncbi:MAG TPA: phospholipase D family protein [Nitrospirota bacterium]|nr:phospholipase D family protein [Nitrospirota bacterium]
MGLLVKIYFIVSLLILSSSSANVVDAKDLTLNNAPTQVYFSPKGGCTEAIVDALNHAKSEILVQAYSFTSKDIAKALLEAHKRGVHIEIILDRSNRSKNYSAGDFAAHMGISTYIDSAHAIAHNKIIVIDKKTVITGSFNFTKAAENNNAENLLIISSTDLAKYYIQNWETHKEHSVAYMGR